MEGNGSPKQELKYRSADEPTTAEHAVNPCIRCGACCAYFRVQFYWREVEKSSELRVPENLTEDLDSFKKCMKGTTEKRPQCVALRGRIGKNVGCSIYQNRPSVCREFAGSYSDGKPNKRCDLARAAHGLPPLRPKDWGYEK